MIIKGIMFGIVLGVALNRFFSVGQWQFWLYLVGILVVFSLIED